MIRSGLSANEIPPDHHSSMCFYRDQKRTASDISAGAASDGDLVTTETPLGPIRRPHPRFWIGYAQKVLRRKKGYVGWGARCKCRVQ